MGFKTSMPVWALLLAGVLLPAQELVRLADGTSVEAKVTVKGRTAKLVSVFGERTVAAADIAGREPLDALRSRYQTLLGETPEGHAAARAALARWCVDQGLLSAAKDLLAQVYQTDIDQPLARELTAKLARSWRLCDAEEGTRPQDLAHVAEALFLKVAPKGLVEAVLASEKALELPSELVLRRALKGLKHEKPEVRWMCARVLAPIRSEPDRIKPLFKRGLLDDALAVRREAVRSLKVTNDPVFVRLYAKNLMNPNAAVRVNAAEAMAELGMKEGIDPLVAALADAWRPTRNFIASTTQLAYVKDFDVEIAQAAVIADPIVDVVQEGVILDVAVVSVTAERAAYASALSRLTGASLGTDPASWRRYLSRF